jgi:cytochrome c556
VPAECRLTAPLTVHTLKRLPQFIFQSALSRGNFMKRSAVAVALFSSLAAGLAMFAQPASSGGPPGGRPDEVVDFRQSLYTVIGWYNHQLGDMAKGDAPYDKEAFARGAAIIATLSKAAPDAFPPGSGVGDTRARPEIWNDPAKFKTAMENFQEEAAKLSETAPGGDFSAVKAQFGALGKACKACHDDFRKKRR